MKSTYRWIKRKRCCYQAGNCYENVELVLKTHPEDFCKTVLCKIKHIFGQLLTLITRKNQLNKSESLFSMSAFTVHSSCGMYNINNHKMKDASQNMFFRSTLLYTREYGD